MVDICVLDHLCRMDSIMIVIWENRKSMTKIIRILRIRVSRMPNRIRDLKE